MWVASTGCHSIHSKHGVEQVAQPSGSEAYRAPTRLWLKQEQNGPVTYFRRNAFESSPDAVVTVTIVRPFRPPLGTVAVIVVSFCMENLVA